MLSPEAIHPQLTLAVLVRARPGAHTLLREHGIALEHGDRRTLAAACAEHRADPTLLVHAIETRHAVDAMPALWSNRPLTSLVAWIVTRFHDPLRTELPALRALAVTVAARHRGRPDYPPGLDALLGEFDLELIAHLQKEEQVLFPLLIARRGPLAHAPIRAMEREHADHVVFLHTLRRSTREYTPPVDADVPWRALYLGLGALDHDLCLHAALEDRQLFPRALRDRPDATP